MTAPSPDLPRPVNLTLHNVTENQLVEAMVAALQVNIPEWIPQEGATEVMLFESLALVMGQWVYALNQLPRVVLDGLIAIRGFQRKPAVPSAGQITVTLAASTIGTRFLPKGARFRLPLGTGTFDAATVEDVSINPTDGLTAVVNVVAAVPGAATNGVAPGVRAVMVDPYTWVESAIVTTAFTGGGDIEDDATFYGRVAAVFQAQSTTLVVADQFAVAALQVPGVGRAKAYSLWDGVAAMGSKPGHLTVAVAGPDGANVSSGVKTAVLTALSASCVAGLAVHVIDFQRVTMNLAVTYKVAAGYDAATVTPQIESVLRSWINPLTWAYDDTLTSVNQIILRIGQVLGVADVTAITGWTPVTGGNTLPSVGTVTITAT